MSQQQPMSFAQSYILALKVRSKLTKQATDPKTSLRALVTQANMLDNLMDHIASETAKRNQKMSTVIVENENDTTRGRHVTISTPEVNQNTSIAEYEVDSDSDSESESELDSDYYYSSSEEEIEVEVSDDEDEDEDYTNSNNLQQLTNIRRTSRETSMNGQTLAINLLYPNRDNQSHLSVILEELANDDSDEDVLVEEKEAAQGLPDLSRSQSLTDEEDFEQHSYAIETNTREQYQPRFLEPKSMKVNQVHIHDVHSHHRSNAMITVTGVY